MRLSVLFLLLCFAPFGSSQTPTPVATPQTEEPTQIETDPPSTPDPTSSPTAGVPTTASPTLDPTPSPVVQTPSPTDSPTTKPATPAPTNPPTAPITSSITSLLIDFNNVQQLDNSVLGTWESVTAQWFDDSYNSDDDSSNTRAILLRHHRLLQTDPSKIGVSQMQSQYQVTSSQSNGNGGWTIVYDQILTYRSEFGEQRVESLATLPFQFATTNSEYQQILQNSVPGMELVSAPIAVPFVSSLPPTESPTDGDTFWTLPVIIGIACGGAVLLLAVACGAYCLSKPKKDDNHSSSLNNYSRPSTNTSNTMYRQQPTAQITAMNSYDDVSTMDEPTMIVPNVISNASADTYGDQSVATVDYDYSKAYGGGGDTSVVSSVGGTLGDLTRRSNGEPLTSSRVALGASYESDNDDERPRNPIREKIIVIMAPAGKLGVVIDTPDDGAPVVHAVKDSSVIADRIQVGDKLVAVDDDDVRSMTAIKVSKLISKKSANPTRKLTIVRTVYMDE